MLCNDTATNFEITTTEAGGKCKLSFDAELVTLINENKMILAQMMSMYINFHGKPLLVPKLDRAEKRVHYEMNILSGSLLTL